MWTVVHPDLIEACKHVKGLLSTWTKRLHESEIYTVKRWALVSANLKLREKFGVVFLTPLLDKLASAAGLSPATTTAVASDSISA